MVKVCWSTTIPPRNDSRASLLYRSWQRILLVEWVTFFWFDVAGVCGAATSWPRLIDKYLPAPGNSGGFQVESFDFRGGFAGRFRVSQLYIRLAPGPLSCPESADFTQAHLEPAHNPTLGLELTRFDFALSRVYSQSLQSIYLLLFSFLSRRARFNGLSIWACLINSVIFPLQISFPSINGERTIG